MGQDELRSVSRSRRRRTIDPNQLTLLEEGEIGYAYAYSFIVTNLAGDVIDTEAWFQMRALIEERIKDSKWGMALRHPPSGYEAVNRTWMWAALLALNCSAWLQSLAGLDTGPDGRAHGKRLRRELICVAVRVLHHARRLVVRSSPEHRHGVFAALASARRAPELCRALSQRAPPGQLVNPPDQQLGSQKTQRSLTSRAPRATRTAPMSSL